MNRVGLGLAVGAGYVLGRTKKMKLAVAVGSLVAGKRMQLSPRAVADLVSQQLQNNPQFKEIGDQLREDLRGVGKAASGALVERRLDALADRLHGRTAQVRDQLAGVTPDHGPDDEEPEESEDSEQTDTEEAEESEQTDTEEAESEEPEAEEEPRGKAARKAPVRKGTAKKATGKSPAAKRTATKKTAAKKPAAKKTAAARGATRSASRAAEGR